MYCKLREEKDMRNALNNVFTNSEDVEKNFNRKGTIWAGAVELIIDLLKNKSEEEDFEIVYKIELAIYGAMLLCLPCHDPDILSMIAKGYYAYWSKIIDAIVADREGAEEVKKNWAKRHTV